MLIERTTKGKYIMQITSAMHDKELWKVDSVEYWVALDCLQMVWLTDASLF